MKRRLRRIDFACNDPDSGSFEGRVRMIEFGEALRLEGDLYGRGIAFAVEDSRLRIHRRWFAFKCRKVWLGNWCWDAFWFEPTEAKRLLRHLRSSGKWSVDGGLAKLCEWFERDGFGEAA